MEGELNTASNTLHLYKGCTVLYLTLRKFHSLRGYAVDRVSTMDVKNLARNMIASYIGKPKGPQDTRLVVSL